MSAVNSPTRQGADRFSSPVIDVAGDAERQLCGAVDAMIAGVSRVLQQSASEMNAKVQLQGATTSFLRVNGIRISQDNAEESAGARAGPRSNADGGGGAAEAALRTQLENCRDLLRRVDSERRHLRKQCVHLQGEQDRRRAEVGAVHRYSTESHQRSLTLERHAAEERQRRRQLEEQLDTQTQELMELRRLLRALPSEVMTSLNSPKSSSSTAASTDGSPPLVPDRRFEEAFRDKMNSIVYKRRYRQASSMHQAAREQLEAVRMEQQDPLSAGAHWPTLVRSAFAGASAAPDALGSRSGSSADASAPGEENGRLASDAFNHAASDSSTAASLASAVFWQSAFDFPFQLPFSTATPQDAVIKALLYRSQYAEPLTQLREHTLRLCSRLKTTQDAGLRTLYMTFNQAMQRAGATAAQAQSRSLYERQMDKMQRAHRDLLYSLIEQVNHAAMAIPEMERGGSGVSARGTTGLAQAVQRRDVGCSAHETVSVEEYRASHLKEQLSRLKLQSLEAAAAALKEKESAAMRCATARQEALQALQSLKKLTTGVVASVADDDVYDPLAHLKEPLTEDILDDPRLVTKVVEATDLTLTYVRQLARGSRGNIGVAGKRQGSPSGHRPSMAASARLSSSLTFGYAPTHEDAYGRIIDIHQRGGNGGGVGPAAPSPTTLDAAEAKAGRRTASKDTSAGSRKGDRRKSAPASLNNTVTRSRSKWSSAAAAGVVSGRRQTVPQLPAVRTPKAPTATRRGTRGRPDGGEVMTVPTPPLEEKKEPSSAARSLVNAPKGEERETPSKADGRTPNAAVSVIELGFSVHNIRLD